MGLDSVARQFAPARSLVDHHHIVQFFESDTSLVEAVSRFLHTGIKKGEAGLVIANLPHLQTLETLFQNKYDLPVSDLLDSGQLILLDATQALKKFMVNGAPSSFLFQNTIGEEIKALCKRFNRVCAYGEMVGVLWREGNIEATLHLEELWNQLTHSLPLNLLCGYSLSDFNAEILSPPFLKICATHTQVLPAESFLDLENKQAQNREIAFLQQQATALKSELNRRKLAEAALKKANEKLEQELLRHQTTEEQLRKWKHAFENASWGISLSTPDNHFIAVNEAFARMHQSSVEEWIGRSLLDMFDEDSKKRLPELTETVHRIGNLTYESIHKRKDGTCFPVLTEVAALKDANGKVLFRACNFQDISHRKNTERALQRERAQLEAAFQAMSDGVLVFDMKGQAIMLNDAQARLCGYASTSEMKQNLTHYKEKFELFHMDGNPLPFEEWPIHQILQGKSLPKLEFRMKRKDTPLNKLFSFSGEPIFDLHGEQILALTILRDITKEKEAEFHLRESETQFRSMAESLPQLSWIANAEGEIFWFNQRWNDFIGVPPQQMEGWGWHTQVDPKELPRVLREWNEGIKKGTLIELEFPLRRRDGVYRWFLTRVAPIRNAKGELVKWFGSNTDITEQKRTLEAQKFLSSASLALNTSFDFEQSLQKLSDLVNSSISDWCVIDLLNQEGVPKRVALSHPKTWRESLILDLQKRYPPDWNASSGSPQVMRSGVAELYSDISDELIAKSARDQYHLTLLRKLGMKSALIVPILARGKVLGSITLVTSQSGRHYDEFDLETLKELGRRTGSAMENAYSFQQARDAVRARDEFLSIASHELKTPLTSLKLQSQMRKRALSKGDLSVFSPNRVEKFIHDDEKQINRLTRLVDDMLDISRLNSGKFSIQREKMDLVELAQEVIDRFSLQLRSAHINLIFEAKDPVVGNWDRYRIEQVIINLLTNALKYSPGKPVRVAVEKKNDKALIVIQDQGIGISKQDQTRIFEQFERAVCSNEVSGLGLGLFIVQQLVQAHGGKVYVESELGVGSTFTVELPQ